jgi:hypothetical protein
VRTQNTIAPRNAVEWSLRICWIERMCRVAKAFLILLAVSPLVAAEIDNRKILLEFFNGCLTTDYERVGVGFAYCGCATNQISKKMDLEEVLLLGLDLDGLSEREQARFLLTNKKFKEVLIECVPLLLEQ